MDEDNLFDDDDALDCILLQEQEGDSSPPKGRNGCLAMLVLMGLVCVGVYTLL